MKHDNRDRFEECFNCKDCPGAELELCEFTFTSTGIVQCTVFCKRCKDCYTVRYDPEKPNKWVICNRKVLIFNGNKSRRYYVATREALTVKRAELRGFQAES